MTICESQENLTTGRTKIVDAVKKRGYTIIEEKMVEQNSNMVQDFCEMTTPEFFASVMQDFRFLVDTHGFSVIDKQSDPTRSARMLLLQRENICIEVRHEREQVEVFIYPSSEGRRKRFEIRLLVTFANREDVNLVAEFDEGRFGPNIDYRLDDQTIIITGLKWYANLLQSYLDQISPLCDKNTFQRKETELAEWKYLCMMRRQNVLKKETNIAVLLPRDEQIKAMLEWKVDKLLRQHNLEPSTVNVNAFKYLTVTHEYILTFLKSHPKLATAFFDENRATISRHDVIGIDKEDEHFIVFDWDHGKRRGVTRYENVEEAVTVYLVDRYGLYNRK